MSKWLIAMALLVAASGTAQSQEAALPDDMRAAGGAALAALADDASAEAAAEAAFAAMRPYQWQPIATAPMDRQILLSRTTPAGFELAIGSWEVVDEPPVLGGRWTTDKWWDTPATLWMDIPQPATAP